MGSLKKSNEMEQEKSNTNSTRESNVSKKYSKTSLISKTISKTSLIHKTSRSSKEPIRESIETDRESRQLESTVSRQESTISGRHTAPNSDSKAKKLDKLATKMESILEDLPPDRNDDPKRSSIIKTIQTEIAANKGAKAFNKQIGKIKRDGKIAEQPKYSKLERMQSNNTDPEPQDHYIYTVDEAARATMGTRKATEAFSTTSKIEHSQNKFSIAEIPTFSQIKESGVREKLSNLNRSILEDWKSQSEPEPDFRDNSNLLGKSPRKKKKKSSKKGTKNESDIWSDNNNNPERVPESVIHENLNTLNRSIIEEWQSENEARGREDKWPYKISPQKKKKKGRSRSARSRSRSRSRSRKRKQKNKTN